MNRYVDLKYPNLMFTMLYDILDVFFIHSNGQKSVQQLAYIKNGYVHCMYTGGSSFNADSLYGTSKFVGNLCIISAIICAKRTLERFFLS